MHLLLIVTALAIAAYSSNPQRMPPPAPPSDAAIGIKPTLQELSTGCEPAHPDSLLELSESPKKKEELRRLVPDIDNDASEAWFKTANDELVLRRTSECSTVWYFLKREQSVWHWCNTIVQNCSY